jgi:hypothetical protein
MNHAIGDLRRLCAGFDDSLDRSIEGMPVPRNQLTATILDNGE